MLRCIVRQSYANRTRRLLKLEVAVAQGKNWKEQLQPTTGTTKNWWCGMGCMPILVSHFWLGFKVWYRFSGSPALLPVLSIYFDVKDSVSPCQMFSTSKQFCAKSATHCGTVCRRLWEISHRLWANQRPTLGKWATDFGKISQWFWGKIYHRFWEIPSPIGEIRHRFCGNPSPILWKSVTDFGKICHRLWGICHWFWGNPSPTLRSPVFLEKQFPFSGKTCSVFGMNRLRFVVKNRLRVW